MGLQRRLIDADPREVRGFVWGAERSSVQANERSLGSPAQADCFIAAEPVKERREFVEKECGKLIDSDRI